MTTLFKTRTLGRDGQGIQPQHPRCPTQVGETPGFLLKDIPQVPLWVRVCTRQGEGVGFNRANAQQNSKPAHGVIRQRLRFFRKFSINDPV